MTDHQFIQELIDRQSFFAWDENELSQLERITDRLRQLEAEMAGRVDICKDFQ